MGHSITDVDSLGAGIGIYCAAKNLDKKAQIVRNDPDKLSQTSHGDIFRGKGLSNRHVYK